MIVDLNFNICKIQIRMQIYIIVFCSTSVRVIKRMVKFLEMNMETLNCIWKKCCQSELFIYEVSFTFLCNFIFTYVIKL